jgi:hypothetical protein
MKLKLLATLLGCCLGYFLQAQDKKSYRNYPIVLTAQFHSLTMPFKNIASNFSNVGFGIGTEISHNGGHNWAQQISAIWYRNKQAGNGLLFYTQTAWRPTVVSGIYTEVKAGIGYLYSFRPVDSYKPVNGNWEPVQHKGKGMLVFPVGVSIGYNKYKPGTYFSPFVSYQFLIVSGYNKSIPVVPETLIQVGSRIHLKP